MLSGNSRDKCAGHVDMQTHLQSLVSRFLGRKTLTSLPGRPETGYVLYTHEKLAGMWTAHHTTLKKATVARPGEPGYKGQIPIFI